MRLGSSTESSLGNAPHPERRRAAPDSSPQAGLSNAGASAGTDAAVARPAGNGQELPGAVSLDSSPGKETLYLVHCPDSSEAPRCTTTGASSRPQCPKGCALIPFVIETRDRALLD